MRKIAVRRKYTENGRICNENCGTALRQDTEDVRGVSLERCAIAIGSEGQGLSDAVLAMCRKTLKIPMSERCESLNAAIAAAVLLWESYR